MIKQDKMKINNLLVRMKQMEDKIERLSLFDNQIEANYNRVFDYGVTNRIMLDEQCRKIGELKAKFEAKSCAFVKTTQTQAIQEFVDELRKKCSEVKGYEYCFESIEHLINQLLEEYKK